MTKSVDVNPSPAEMKTHAVRERPWKRPRLSYFGLLPAEAVVNVVRHLSLDPRRRNWRASVDLSHAQAVVRTGGRLGVCARREFGRLPQDLYFGKLHQDVLLQVLRNMSETPASDNWQDEVRKETIIGVLRSGGIIADLARSELLAKRGKKEHDLFFGELSENVCRNILRFLSNRPDERDWWTHIDPGDGQAAEYLGGTIANVFQHLGQ